MIFHHFHYARRSVLIKKRSGIRDNSLDYDIAIDAAPYFGIKKDEGASIIKEMKDKVSLFRYVAGKYEVSQSEINRMESAFNI